MLHYPQQFTPLLLDKLRGDNTLAQTITYVIIAGLLLKKHFDLELFNALLSLICHNTAYLRGLTQYFCFYEFSSIEEHIAKDSLVRRLYQQFTVNSDAIRLTERVHLLVSTY